MKLLFCKLRYIGDALLLTGTLRAVKLAYPEAEIWVAVREGTEGILSGCPEIDRIVTFARPKEHGRKSGGFFSDFATIAALRRERFDFVFELSNGDRGRSVALLCGAKRRVANRHYIRPAFWRRVFRNGPDIDCTTLAAAEADHRPVAHALGLPPATPLPVFERDRADFSFAGKPERPTLFLHPAASQALKIWPEEKWSELIAGLVAGFDIILSCGPAAHEVAYCEKILAGIPDASRVRFTGGKLSWTAMAGALYSSVAYIGADTAAMHLASACRIPILGIFGRNTPEHLAQWTPRGDRVRIVTFASGESGIADIPVARVREALDSLLPR